MSLRQNSYLQLPERFYEKRPAIDLSQYSIFYWNHDLGKEFGLDPETFFTEQKQLVPAAQAYAGHQFGHFVPQLGDGRALLLGEMTNGIHTVDVHLKGAGRTRFSRRGDGKATLGAAIREALVSEGMHGLRIPTSRTLAVLKTNETVWRESAEPGAILVRLAQSHVRVGTFEYFAAQNDREAVQRLVEHTLVRFGIDSTSKDGALLLWQRAIDKQADLVARWMSVGFIHGVMNTDNTTLSGETLDYGPCAFMEEYNPLQVFSSIDQAGRYAYIRQPSIMKWNLSVLGMCLLPLFHADREAADKIYQQEIEQYDQLFRQYWLQRMVEKLGLTKVESGDERLVQNFLDLLQKYKIDFTTGFLQMDSLPGDDFDVWREQLKKRTAQEKKESVVLNQSNPLFLPRNHLVEGAIREATQNNNAKPFENLISVIKTPFVPHPGFESLQKPATPEQRVEVTFCGT